MKRALQIPLSNKLTYFLIARVWRLKHKGICRVCLAHIGTVQTVLISNAQAGAVSRIPESSRNFTPVPIAYIVHINIPVFFPLPLFRL